MHTPKQFVPITFLAWCDSRLERYAYKKVKACATQKLKQWVKMEKAGVKGVDLNSIPDVDKLEYNIPFPADFSSTFQRWKEERTLPALKKSQPAQKVEKKVISMPQHTLSSDMVKELTEALMDEKNAGFIPFYNLIKGKYCLPVEKCREFAEKWAAWDFILRNYQRSSNSLENLFKALYRVFPGWFDSKHSLSNFKRKCENNGIEEAIIDQRCIKKRQERISDFQYAFIRSAFTQSAKNSARSTHDKLVKACAEIGEKPYCLRSIINYFRSFEQNLELKALRYGRTAIQSDLPYASLLPASARNVQWAMDGWTLPFWGEKMQRYILHFIIDNHSRKVIGFNVAVSENTNLILETIDDAIRNTGFLPAELVSDKHSFHRTEIATSFKDKTEAMGMVWTVTVNAQRNGVAERYNQYFNDLCKDFRGYLGKNVTAKGKGSRLSQEEYDELRKSKNWLTDEEIRAIAVYVVTTYNSTGQPLLAGKSPNEKYSESHDGKAFKVSEADRARLLKPVKNYKVVRGQITIKVGMTKHEFQLPAHLIAEYNNRYLEVHFEDLQQGIYVFDEKTGLAEEIKPKTKIHGAVADQTEEDKRLLNQQIGRQKGSLNQARKKDQERLIEALKENPEAIELINSYVLDKDIRKVAQENREMQRAMQDMGINKNLLPIRDTPVNAQESKEVRSPFGKTKNKIRVMSSDDIIGTN